MTETLTHKNAETAAQEITIAQIVAFARGGVIGLRGTMPWHIPEDLKHFKRVTTGSPVIMGRKTHESIGRALPGRLNIVITRQAQYEAAGCTVVPSIEEAIAVAREAAKETGTARIFIIGGAETYRASREVVDEIWCTEIAMNCEGDAFFDAPESDKWTRTEIKALPATDTQPALTFCLYRRRGAKACSVPSLI